MQGSTDSGSGPAESPLLSVVMCVHDVETYLAEALQSVLGQSIASLEVVVVDDGSTDDSAAIAADLAAGDGRVRVVRQPNAGLGAARNAGVRHARGAFLTFCDGDDVVPPGSYEAMMAALDRSGSDMVVGTVERLAGRGRRMGRLMRENHARRRMGVTLDDMPQMLADVFAVNKVFRRSFWDRTGLRFPEGTRYEDQPTMTRAFLATDRFDVLAQTVYLWRKREDRSSITQNRHRIEDLRDRLATKRTTTEAVMAARPDLRELWFGTILPVDVWSYFEAAPSSSDEYWRVLREATRELWDDDTVPITGLRVPVLQRLMGWLVVNDRRDDLRRLLEALDDRSRVLPLEIRGEDVVLCLPALGLHLEGLPAPTVTLAPHELEWETRVLEAGWTGGVLRLQGFALTENLPTGGRSTSLSATLVGPDAVRERLAPRPRTEPRATRRMARHGQDFDDCGFEIDVDVAALAARRPPPDGTTSSWRLRLSRAVDGVRRGGGVTGYRTTHVDRDWHHLSGGTEARLRDVRGSLVLDIRSAREGEERAQHQQDEEPSGRPLTVPQST